MERGFWIWKEKLPDVLLKLAELYDINQLNIDVIKYELIGTSDEKSDWFECNFKNICFNLAYDHDNNEIIHLKIYSDIKET